MPRKDPFTHRHGELNTELWWRRRQHEKLQQAGLAAGPWPLRDYLSHYILATLQISPPSPAGERRVAPGFRRLAKVLSHQASFVLLMQYMQAIPQRLGTFRPAVSPHARAGRPKLCPAAAAAAPGVSSTAQKSDDTPANKQKRRRNSQGGGGGRRPGSGGSSGSSTSWADVESAPAWRVFGVSVPADQDPGKDSFGVHPALLAALARKLGIRAGSSSGASGGGLALPDSAVRVVRKSFDARSGKGSGATG